MENKCIVRLKTSYWHTKHGCYSTKSIIYQKRLSSGYCILKEDIDGINIQFTMDSIINLYECNDGLYQAIETNFSTDYESGIVDDYDIKLIPYKKEQSC